MRTLFDLRIAALWIVFLGFSACASSADSGRSEDEGILLHGGTVEEARRAAVEVLKEAQYAVVHKEGGTILGTTAGGLAPDGFSELLECGTGISYLGGTVSRIDYGRPTGHFEIHVAESDDGARIRVAADFVPWRCRSGAEEDPACGSIACASTGVLEEQIRERAIESSRLVPSRVGA